MTIPRRVHSTIAILAGSLLLSPPAFADDENGATGYGAFAFSDSSGTRVLALGTLKHPEKIHTLVTPTGQELPVRFEASQPESPQSTGRQTYWNFDNTRGQRFRIENGVLPEGDVGFLATDSLLSVGQPMELFGESPETGDLSPRRDRALEEALGRKILRSWNLASFDSGSVRLYEFVTKGTSHLGTLVLYDGSKAIRSDIEAQSPDSTEVWREGDDGHIDGEAIKVLFIIKGKAGIFMADSWGAEEGEDLTLLRCPPGGTTFENDATAYRYWYPR